MLTLCLLKPLDDFYNYDKFVVDHEFLKLKLAELMKMDNYSQDIKQAITQMLTINEHNRPCFGDLFVKP